MRNDYVVLSHKTRLGIDAFTNPDGSDLRVITPNSGESYNDAVPSPSAPRLAFMRWHVGNATMRIYTRSLAGGKERPVTPVRLLGWLPDWSPNGRTILFSSNLFASRPNGAIFTVSSSGDSLRTLTHPAFPNEDWGAAYSPTGGRIVFASDRHRPDRFFSGTDIYTVLSDGSHPHKIPLPSSILYPDMPQWSTAPLEHGRTALASDPVLLRRSGVCWSQAARFAVPHCR